MRVGAVSDTHGLVRPELLDALRGCAHILHAGDIGAPGVLDALTRIAPVTAVRGNNDVAAWARRVPVSATVALGGRRFHVIHEIARLALDPVAHRIDAVIFGHSHRPSRERREGVLYLNPGSAGPRRFRLPVSLCLFSISARSLRARFVELKV